MEMQTLPSEVIKLINERIYNELYAQRYYLAASNFCKLNGFDVAAEFYLAESVDEGVHAKILQDHLVGWNTMPELPTISTPEIGSTLNEVTEGAYQMEYDLLKLYEETMDAVEDYTACEVFFIQFINIQNQSVIEYADKLKKLEGITDIFQLRMMEKKVFK